MTSGSHDRCEIHVVTMIAQSPRPAAVVPTEADLRKGELPVRGPKVGLHGGTQK